MAQKKALERPQKLREEAMLGGGADRIAAAWEKITDQIGRESQIALYKASLGI